LPKHFSAKEASQKHSELDSVGGFRDIELGATQLGRPTVSLSERAKTVADKNKIEHSTFPYRTNGILSFVFV
jgi:phosphopantetheinyl transferase (holo-ACP synthase)